LKAKEDTPARTDTTYNPYITNERKSAIKRISDTEAGSWTSGS